MSGVVIMGDREWIPRVARAGGTASKRQRWKWRTTSKKHSRRAGEGMTLDRFFLRWGNVRSAKRCRHCILGLLYSAYFGARVLNLTRNPCPSTAVGCTVYTEHCVNFWDSSFKLVRYIKPNIQRRHLFADLPISHLWVLSYEITGMALLVVEKSTREMLLKELQWLDNSDWFCLKNKNFMKNHTSTQDWTDKRFWNIRWGAWILCTDIPNKILLRLWNQGSGLSLMRTT